MDVEMIRKKVRCCTCLGSLERGNLNMVTTDLAARWEYPTSGNVVTGESGRAVAIVCDGCVEKDVARVVEFRPGEVVYHAVSELEPAAAGKRPAVELFDTCEDVGVCPRPTGDAAPFHHFYWDGDRDAARMDEIHGPDGRGHDDPLSHYGAVVCKSCGRQALVRQDAEDFPEI